MKTNIKATSMEMTPAIANYIESKISYLDKLMGCCENALAEVEVGKITNRHKSGKIMFAEINLTIDGKFFRQVVKDNDLYAAIDLAKDKIERDISSYLKKKNHLLRRGGRVIKDFVKGFYPNNKDKDLTS